VLRRGVRGEGGSGGKLVLALGDGVVLCRVFLACECVYQLYRCLTTVGCLKIVYDL
jgi:acetyl-CoA carboxylase alpha subunit